MVSAADGPTREDETSPERRAPPAWPALAVLVTWMVCGLGLTAAVLALAAGASLLVAGALAGAGLLVGLAGVPLMLYDAAAARGTVGDEGFRFDVLATAVGLVLLYPVSAPLYAFLRFQGPFLVARGVDPGELGVEEQLAFAFDDLLHPAADEVPSTWPVGLVIFAWIAIVAGDAFLAAALLDDGTVMLVVGGATAVSMRLFGVVPLLVDVHVVADTGGFETRAAVAWGLATAVLYPIAAVGYVPVRLYRTYG